MTITETDLQSGRSWRRIRGASILRELGCWRYKSFAGFACVCTRARPELNLDPNPFRWASTRRRPNTDGWRNGRWCCTAPESHHTRDYRRRILTRNWRSSRRPTRSDWAQSNRHSRQTDRRLSPIQARKMGIFRSKDVYASASLPAFSNFAPRGWGNKYYSDIRFARTIASSRANLPSSLIWTRWITYPYWDHRREVDSLFSLESHRVCLITVSTIITYHVVYSITYIIKNVDFSV